MTEIFSESSDFHVLLIKLNHMLVKDRDKDRWLTQIRAPYERVFSKRNRKVNQSILKKSFDSGCIRINGRKNLL